MADAETASTVGVREAPNHIPVLTGVRGWAAIWVLMYHAWGHAGAKPIVLTAGSVALDFTPFFRMGGAGVTIFFVLSGFLLSLPFAEWQAGRRSKPHTGRYLIRRILRVFPAYYVQLAILLAIAATQSGYAALPNVVDSIRHLLMLFVPPPLGVEPRNGVWWTLPIEFSFYLALPFLAVMLRADRWMWLLAVSAVSMVLWRYLAVTWLADAPIPARVVAAYQLPGSMDSFGIGMLASLMYVSGDRMLDWLRRPPVLDAAALCGLGLMTGAIYWMHYASSDYWKNSAIFYLWTPMLSVGIALVVLAGMRGGRVALLLFANRFMVFAGLVSYSVYLWHFPVLEWIRSTGILDAADGFRLPALMALGLPATFLVATLSYVLVERPCMHWRRPVGSPSS